jgi:type II secretory pathway component PulF
MPNFRFHARDAQGTAQQGMMASPSMEMLTSDLRGRGLLVLDIEPVEETKPSRGFSLNPFSLLPPTSFDAEVGFRQLATMLHSGLSLLAGLRTVAEQARRPRATRAWEDVAERIEEGGTFFDALSAHPRLFSPHVLQLVRVGEYAGTLEASLTRAAEHLERTRQLRLIVLNALAYPLIVLLLAIGVAGFMVLSVIPKIQKFLNGRKLPGITQLLVDISNFLTIYLPYILLGIVVVLVALFVIYRWPPGRLAIDRILLRLPIVGGIFRLSGTAVFSRGLGILLESGVTLVDSLKTAEHLVGNRAIRVRIASAREAVLRGESLAGGLAGGREFLPMLGRMIAVGETSGTLAPVLSEVAKFHENQLLIAIRRMSVLVEPVIIVLVGGIVGFVYTAFFIAIFSLASGGR